MLSGGEARLALAPHDEAEEGNQEEQQYYQVLLGFAGNTQTVIRRGNTELATVQVSQTRNYQAGATGFPVSGHSSVFRARVSCLGPSTVGSGWPPPWCRRADWSWRWDGRGKHSHSSPAGTNSRSREQS